MEEDGAVPLAENGGPAGAGRDDDPVLEIEVPQNRGQDTEHRSDTQNPKELPPLQPP